MRDKISYLIYHTVSADGVCSPIPTECEKHGASHRFHLCLKPKCLYPACNTPIFFRRILYREQLFRGARIELSQTLKHLLGPQQNSRHTVLHNSPRCKM